MARDHARIYLSIWDDPEFLALPMAAQHAFFLLLSQRPLSYCGVMVYAPGVLADLTADVTEAKVRRAVQVLEASRFVVVDPRTHELVVRSYVRWDGVLDRSNMGKATARALGRVMSGEIRGVVLGELARLYEDAPSLTGWAGFKEIDPVGFDTVTAMSSEVR